MNKRINKHKRQKQQTDKQERYKLVRRVDLSLIN